MSFSDRSSESKSGGAAMGISRAEVGGESLSGSSTTGKGLKEGEEEEEEAEESMGWWPRALRI